MKSRILLLAFLLSAWSLTAMDHEQTNHNIAVFGGGGVNSFASLLLAEAFESEAGRPFDKLFHNTISISGGAIPGTLKLHNRHAKKAREAYENIIDESLPYYNDFFLDLEDSKGVRRNNLEKALEIYFGGMTFGAGKNNRFIHIASVDGYPYYYCDPDLPLPANALRCEPGTSVTTGIVNSSCTNISIGQSTKLLLYQRQRFRPSFDSEEKLSWMAAFVTL